jgi:hypothetical protein
MELTWFIESDLVDRSGSAHTLKCSEGIINRLDVVLTKLEKPLRLFSTDLIRCPSKRRVESLWIPLRYSCRPRHLVLECAPETSPVCFGGDVRKGCCGHCGVKDRSKNLTIVTIIYLTELKDEVGLQITAQTAWDLMSESRFSCIRTMTCVCGL